MPTSPLKRLSGGGGGRLRRLLASLRAPAPLPVQTGFPTSLADIVVKNHDRLRIPRRRRHRAPGAAAVPPPAAATEPQQRRELSVAAPARRGQGAGFSIRPGLVAAGGAVALVLLVIWSKQLVAAATLASVALSWIESARTARPPRPATEEVLVDLLPIREAAESASLCSADADSGDDLGRGDDDSSTSSSSVKKPKQSRRSLRKLLANKLRSGKTPRGTADSGHGGDAGERPETTRRLNAEPFAAAAAAAPAEATPTPTPAPPREAITDDERCQSHCRRRRAGALPLPALMPIILAGLVAGKLPALALAVLCAAFSSSAERVPAEGQAGR